MQEYDILILGISHLGTSASCRRTGNRREDIADLYLRDASSPCLAWAIGWAMGRVSGCPRPAAQSAGPSGGQAGGLLAQRGVRV